MKTLILTIILAVSGFAYSFTDIDVKCDKVLKNTSYTVCYDFSKKGPKFSYYDIEKTKVNISMPRYNSFLVDNRIDSKYRPLLKNFRGCGDRGHLSPAFVNDWSIVSRKEANLLSNIVPQNSELNQNGAWRESEDLEEKLVNKFNTLTVISGVIYDSKPIKCNTLYVPSYFYKIIISQSTKQYIMFKIPNTSVERVDLFKYTTDKLDINLNIPKDYKIFSINEIN